MDIAIADLPELVELLCVDQAPCFVVLLYHQFVKLAASAPAAAPPDAVAVLDTEGEHRFVIVGYDEFLAYMRQFVIHGEIDEAHYLGRHDDVRRAIERGALKSGRQHYILQGYFERRDVRLRPAPSA